MESPPAILRNLTNLKLIQFLLTYIIHFFNSFTTHLADLCLSTYVILIRWQSGKIVEL